MVMQDLKNVENRLKTEELKQISGGKSISGSIISALSNGFKTVYSFGQDFGGAIRRIIKRKLCSF